MLVVVLSVLFVLDILILIVALNLLRKAVGKNLKWSLIITGITFMMFVPAVMALLMKKVSIFSVAPGGIEEWIPFWGSYFGGIIGFAGVLFTTIYIVDKSTKNVEKQLEEQKSQHDEQLKIQKELFEREKKQLEIRLHESKKRELEKRIIEQIGVVYPLLDSLWADVEKLKDGFLKGNIGNWGNVKKIYEISIEEYHELVKKNNEYTFQNKLLHIYIDKYQNEYRDLEMVDRCSVHLEDIFLNITKEKEVRKEMYNNLKYRELAEKYPNDRKRVIESVQKIGALLGYRRYELEGYLYKINN